MSTSGSQALERDADLIRRSLPAWMIGINPNHESIRPFTDLDAATQPALGAELRELEEISLALERHTLADSTRRAYASAWGIFEAFCREHRLVCM